MAGDSVLAVASVGAIDRIGPAQVLAALSLVRQGRAIELGLELNSDIPHNPGFARFMSAQTQTPEMTGRKSWPFQFSAEVISGCLHVGTHMDALIHIQSAGSIFGGGQAADVRTDRGWTCYGQETVPPIIGRGLLLDIPALHGTNRLEDGYEISIGDIGSALDRVGERILPGDIVLVRTGKILDWGNPEKYVGGEPGVGRDAAIWMYDQGMAVLGTDTTGTEPLPFRDNAATTHVAMLVERGVHLLENLTLEDAARERIVTGLFLALPLKITGATGSWLRPVMVI